MTSIVHRGRTGGCAQEYPERAVRSITDFRPPGSGGST